MKDFFNKETLDNIKQFCSENKKYVGVAVILIGLILMLIVVVAGGNNGRHSDTESESQAEISVKDFEFEKDYTNDAKDDINTLLADYYKAYVSDDLDTLGKLATPMSDNEKSYIGVVSQYYESVNDITPYTKNGLKKGSYFVSVKNSIKFTGVDTQAPTLDFFYIETGKDGKLYINNVYSNFNRTYCENELDDDIMEAMKKFERMEEVLCSLPGLDCGACGAPSCQGLAEDIVQGKAHEIDCIFKLRASVHKLSQGMLELAKQIPIYHEPAEINKTEADNDEG